MSSSPVPVDDLVARIKAGDEGCFACGRDNDTGLRLHDWRRTDDTVTARFRPLPTHRGFRGILHGGILAAALDEILAWTGILVAGSAVVTGTLDLKFRRPAPHDAVYDLEGTLEERRGRRLRIAGQATVDGVRIAEGRGLFIATEAAGLALDDLSPGASR